jgi:hypothetical protein
MDTNDQVWMERNYEALLAFAKAHYLRHGRGAVIVEAPLVLDCETMVRAGRVTYLRLSETADNGSVYSAFRLTITRARR